MVWIPIQYRDFYDIPRAFAVEREGTVFFFDGAFDPRLDEYPDNFRVYRIRPESVKKLQDDSWEGIEGQGIYVGDVPVARVKFDPTRRTAVDDSIFEFF